MDEFFTFDPLAAGSKGLLFVGKNVLIYRRDNKTNIHPNELDLPGGGPEENETPFETFKREVKEEFAINITEANIVYVRKYPSVLEQGKFAYFPVARVSAKVAPEIRLDDEGSEFLLMTLNDYIARQDALPIYQERAADYAKLQQKI